MSEQSSLARLRWRLAGWYVITFTVILALLGAGLFKVLNDDQVAQLDQGLSAATREVATAAANVAYAGIDRDFLSSIAIPTVDTRLLVLTPDGAPVQPRAAEDWIRSVARSAQRTGPLTADRELEEERAVRFRVDPFLTSDGTPLVVVAVTDRVEWEERHSSLVAAFVATAAVAILLVGAGGYVLAGRSTIPAERTLAYMRRFMADAAHELRTPLTITRARAEVALQRDRDAAFYKQVLEEMLGDSQKLTRIVNDLLTLARADAGQGARAQRRIYLDDVVSEAAVTAAPLALKKGVGLEVGDFDEAPVLGDPEQLGQLAMILLDNAIRFTPAGGEIRLHVGVEEGSPVLRVTDTGIGIGPEHLPHIFERFYRVDPARSPEEPGSSAGAGVGLGLSIGRWIADLHGAVIGVSSVPGEGTAVRVRFPVAGVG